MKWMKRLSSWVSLFLLGVALIVVYKTFDSLNVIGEVIGQLLDILSPFLIGFILAFLLYGPSTKLESLLKRAPLRFVSRHARPFAVGTVYIVLAALLVLLVVYAVPAVVTGLADFIKALPGYIENVRAFIDEHSKENGLLAGLNVNERMDAFFQSVVETVNGITLSDLTGYVQGVMGALSSIVNIVMAFVISLYMLLGRESLVRALRSLVGLFVPGRIMAPLSGYVHKSFRIFYGYLYGQALDALIIGTILAIGMQIFGVPNGWLLGMLVGIMNMIPYFGAIIGGVFCVLITLLSVGPTTALLVAVYIVVMQQIDGNLLQPRIVGNSIGLRPIYVLLAITLGGGLFGFWGIFLGVPTLAVIQLLIRDLIRYRSRRQEERAAADTGGSRFS
ncbi:MAG: AI-2E family transporter [Clostridiales bacterium]|nr:AI-2E family transporter [Clostridiales bacterium]